MILAEGLDCTGKTTTLMAMRRILGDWTFRAHTKPPKDAPAVAYHTWGLADAHPFMLVDRLHWSEVAYGHVYRSNSGYTRHEWRLVELMLHSFACRVLWMTDDPDAITARWQKDQDNQMYVAQCHELAREYGSIYDGKPGVTYEFYSTLPVTTYRFDDLFDLDVEKPKPKPELISFCKLVRHEAKLVRHMMPPALGFGAWRPNFMVIGEQPGDYIPRGLVEPGFPLSRGKSAELFWEAMDEGDVAWWLGYYTNASAFRDRYDLHHYITSFLKPRKIITLGAEARRIANEAVGKIEQARKIPIHSFDHPSYVARFHSSQTSKWKTTLAESMIKVTR